MRRVELCIILTCSDCRPIQYILDLQTISKTGMQRIKKGKCLATKNFRPLKLLWYCVFKSRAQARRFEKYLKSGSGQAFRNKHLI